MVSVADDCEAGMVEFGPCEVVFGNRRCWTISRVRGCEMFGTRVILNIFRTRLRRGVFLKFHSASNTTAGKSEFVRQPLSRPMESREPMDSRFN